MFEDVGLSYYILKYGCCDACKVMVFNTLFNH